MNYSKSIYFTYMLKSIIKKLEEYGETHETEAFVISLIASVKDSVSDIMTGASNNMSWPISHSDVDYINHCEKLCSILQDFATAKGGIGSENIDLIEKIGALHEDVVSDGIPSIKAAFFTNEVPVWPSFESIWEAFQSDNKCDSRLIYVPFSHINQDASVDNLKWYRDRGYPVIPSEEYDLSIDSPDVVFYNKPYDNIPSKFYIDAIDSHVKRVVYIPYGFEVAGGDQVITYQFRLPLQRKAWKIVGYSEHYKDLARMYGYNDGKNVITLGHPRLDKIEKFLDHKPIVDAEWDKKIGGRKVVLWNTHFTIQPGIAWGTFMEWKNVIFDYFTKNDDIVLLWRPHPMFFGAMTEHNYMNEQKIQELKDICTRSHNIILDETSDYRSSFYASDALISDGTSFLLEYLATEKPILYTPKAGGWGLSDESLVNDYYIANSEADILDFLEMVRNGEDPKYDARMGALETYLVKPDGKIGERIKQYLVSELEKEEIESAQNYVDSIIK